MCTQQTALQRCGWFRKYGMETNSNNVTFDLDLKAGVSKTYFKQILSWYIFEN